jgi:hypothetical protein
MEDDLNKKMENDHKQIIIKVEDNLNFFWKIQNNFNFLKMEDNLIFILMEDDLQKNAILTNSAAQAT